MGGVIHGREKLVELVALGGPQNFLSVDIVANMRIVFVPLSRNISDCILEFLG
jgi:hypothetical protein